MLFRWCSNKSCCIQSFGSPTTSRQTVLSFFCFLLLVFQPLLLHCVCFQSSLVRSHFDFNTLWLCLTELYLTKSLSVILDKNDSCFYNQIKLNVLLTLLFIRWVFFLSRKYHFLLRIKNLTHLCVLGTIKTTFMTADCKSQPYHYYYYYRLL